jgi:hypothetical protein
MSAQRPRNVVTFVAISAAAALTGCILLADSSNGGLGTTCHLSSETATCGACIVKSCQAQVNACCGDATCRTSMSTVDDCAQTGKCALDTTSGAPSKLATCVTESCATPCTLVSADAAVPPKYLSTCTSTYVSGKPECFCSPPPTGSPGNSVQCDRTSFTNSVCCGDALYPRPSTNCTCVTAGCDTTGTGCSCSLYSTGIDSTCTGLVCCQHAITGDCECFNDSSMSCSSSDTQVTSCAAKDVGCGSQHAWLNCSYAN